MRSYKKPIPCLTGFLVAVAGLMGSADLALAGPSSAQGELQDSSLVVERIENGVLLVPDFKITEMDDQFADLVGGYGGWLIDQKLLIGAGAYWLANGSRDFKLSYGGAVVEWFAHRSRPVDFSLRGLVGGGSGTLGIEIEGFPARGFLGPGRFHDDFRRSAPVVALAREGFFVAEPQANVSFRVKDWFRLGVGAGYRLIGGARVLGDRLRGPSATLSFQFGSF